MKTILLLILSFGLFGNNIGAKSRPLTSEGEIKFYLDYAGFKGLNGKTIQEFYLQVFADQFQSNQITSNEINQIEVRVKIQDNFGKTYFSKFWILEILFPAEEKLSESLVVYDQWSANLEPGDYKLIVELNELDGGNSGQINSQIAVIKYNEDEFEISEIEFVTSSQSEGNIQFKKGNLFLKPNPWRRYGILNPIMYLYYELYNSQQLSSDSIVINYLILDVMNKIIKEIPNTKVDLTDNITILNGINVSSIPSGVYTLNIQIDGSQAGKSYSRSQDFEIIQSDYLSLSANSDEFLKISLNISGYVMTVNQLDKFESLEKKHKLEYLVQFWKQNDPTPQTADNEFLNNMIKRYYYAQKKYSWGEIEGWKTDKGRILIKYGMPDDIERYLFEKNSLPYEKWTYQFDREFDFIFCDLRSDGRYTLLHSTKEGEIYDPDWYSQVKQ